MANTDRPFGFEVWGELLRAQMYAVTTALVINIYHNDLICAGGVFVSTPHGYMTEVDDAAVADGTAAILGSVIGIFDENMKPVKYIAATEVGDGSIAGYVLVADHPMQLFVAQEDSDGNSIELSEGSMNANIISVTLSAGDTTTGISKQEIDSSSAATTAALNVKLVHPHPKDTVTEANCRFIVQINEHYYGDTIAGV